LHATMSIEFTINAFEMITHCTHGDIKLSGD